MRTLAIVLFAALTLALPVHAQRTQADVRCKPSGTEFVYDCTIWLARGGKPLEGAQLTVSADMPSMPLAHTVKPVKAKPGGSPGKYRAQLQLEMRGEWAVKMRLSAPVRDQVVVHLDFGEKAATPAPTPSSRKIYKRPSTRQ